MANHVRTVATRARAAERDHTVADADRVDVRQGRGRASRSGIKAGRMIAVAVVKAGNVAGRVAKVGGDCIRVPDVVDEAVRTASGSVRRPTRLLTIRARRT